MRSFRSKPVGWQRDSYRHYLAAKYGSAGNRYFTRRGVAKLEVLRDQLNERLAKASEEDRPAIEAALERLRTEIEKERLRVGPAQEMEEVSTAIGGLPLSTEEWITAKFVLDQPQEVKDRYFRLKDELADVQSRIDALEMKPSLSNLKAQLSAYRSRLLYEKDPMQLKFYNQKIEDLKGQIEARNEFAEQDELRLLKEERSDAIEKIAKIEGRSREDVHPLSLTKEQMERRLIAAFGADEGRMKFDEYLGLKKAYGLRVAELLQPDIDPMTGLPKVFEEGEEMGRPYTVRELSGDPGLRELTNRMTGLLLPVASKYPYERITKERRPELLRAFEERQERIAKVAPEGARELGTAPAPIGSIEFIETGKEMGRQKKFREPVSETVTRVEEREARMRENLNRAREKRKEYGAMEKILEGEKEAEAELKRMKEDEGTE